MSDAAWTKPTKVPRVGPEPKPAPPRPYVECCAPVWSQFPSGRYWAHSRWCPENRLQKVRTPAEEEARRLHPAHPENRLTRLQEALKHPLDCDCSDCRYFFAHADDDDDYQMGRTYAGGREDL
jgi:hypothetical protein